MRDAEDSRADEDSDAHSSPEWGRIAAYFSNLGQRIGTAGAIGELIALLASGRASPERYDALVKRHGARRESWFIKGRLDLVLGFMQEELTRGALEEEASRDVARLRGFLGVQGDEFIKHRHNEVTTILREQLELLLEGREEIDGALLQQVSLQRAFDISYDQYLDSTRIVLERLWGDLTSMLASTGESAARSSLSRQIMALEPIYHLAISQRRTLGTLR